MPSGIPLRPVAYFRSATIAIGLVMLLLAQPADSQIKKATLTVGTNADWAALPESLLVRNFPLLVRLDKTTFDFSQAQSNGSDLRFATVDNKPLPHQIESWDAAGGRAAIWVRLDSLKGGTTRAIRMSWGNPADISASNGAKVFDTTDGFLGVWHLQESADTVAGRFRDATGFERHGTGFHLAAAATVPGIIGNTQTFNPADSTYIHLGDVGASRSPDSAYTLSMWVKGPGNQHDMRIFSESADSISPISTLGTGTGSETSRMDFYLRNDTATQLVDHGRTQAVVFDDAWHHVALVQDRGSYALFVDGREDKKGTFIYDTLFSSTRTTLGALQRSSVSNHFKGNIDEVQVSRVPRSPDYLRALYESQKAGQVMVGNPVPDGCTEQFGTTKDTVRVAELGSTSVAGVAACALRTVWDKVLDDSTLAPVTSQGLTLDITGGRVSGDTTYHIRFRALYGAIWRSKDVVVRIVENAPDPEFSLSAPQTWNGRDSLSLQPIILNLDAIHASQAPVIHYAWTRTGIDVSARENLSSLTLLQGLETGESVIGLCLDNGGTKACKSVTINVEVAAGLKASRPHGAEVEFANGFIHWNAKTQVRIHSLDGRILLDRTGRPGQKLEIPQALRRALDRREHQIRLTPIR
ncbi:MAG: DUF2341 domain-containing protein [Fibrobacteria bacterium]